MIARAVTTALLVVGACAGAALALPLVTLDDTWRIAVMLMAVVVGVLLAKLLTQEDEPEPTPRPAEREQYRPAETPATAQTTVTATSRATTRIVLDVDTPSSGGGWWTQTGNAPQSTGNGDAPRPVTRARDLSGYAENARVVQCPRCGSFQIDVTSLAGGYSFRCRTDEHAWQWQPGRAWPATVVVSRRRNP
jgi:hypothetical protein